MKDLNTHILHKVDDGPLVLEESLEILNRAYLNGVTDVVLTPHYVKDSQYNVKNKDKKVLFKELKSWVDVSNINVNLYLGNEICVNDKIPSFVNEVSTINNSRYVLIELPLEGKCDNIFKYISKLKKKNMVPIIAHPERYLFYYKDYAFFKNLYDMGCLFQGNIGSLYGRYGIKSKRMIRDMLKKDMIHFMASDIHDEQDKIYQKNYYKKLLRIVKDANKVNDLLENNFDKVINNIEII